jgi:sulfur relay (sulfurtransferase) DsrC/TusE family protein
MSITVNGKTLETDAAGFLVNPNDWSDEVADVLVKRPDTSH